MVFLMKAWIIITSTQMYNFKKDYLKIFFSKNCPIYKHMAIFGSNYKI